MNTSYSAGGVVVNNKGEVLVVSQKGKSWSLPKGHIEPEEDKLQAARREVYEESGVTSLTMIKDLGSYERPKMGPNNEDDPSELKRMYFYLFTTTHQDKLQPHDADNPEARWVEVDKVADLLTHPKDKQFFESIRPQLNELSKWSGLTTE